MGWCGVGVVIMESIELSEYPCEFARGLFCVTLILDFSGGGKQGSLGGKHTLVFPPRLNFVFYFVF